MHLRAVYSCCVAFAALSLFTATIALAAGRSSFATPAISPDGREIAFVSGGSIWTVPANGGVARLLVAGDATNARPLFSPDGTKLAFTSTKTGNGDIYVLTLATGSLARLTYDDGRDLLDGWSRDGWIYFENASHNIQGDTDIYRVRAAGGTPLPVEHEAYVEEYFGAPSPDGRELAFNARGWAGYQWWRVGHSHLDDTNIWIRHGMGAHPAYTRLTLGLAKNEWPMWAGERRLYFMSDRDGAQNIWEQTIGGAPRKVTHFRGGRVVWPTISASGDTIVFERDFGVWKLDTHTGRARRVPIELRGVVSQPQTAYVHLSDRFTDYRVSPDGRKIAFIVRGRLFAASAKGGPAFQVPTGTQYAREMTWSPDSDTLAFAAGRGHEDRIYTYDFLDDRRTQLTSEPADIRYLRYDPSGKGERERMAFEQGGKELRILDVVTKAVRTIATGYLPLTPDEPDRGLVWSPDGSWIAYFAGDNHNFSNVWVVNAENPRPRAISFLANGDTNTVSWSRDGKYILFDTGQRTEMTQVARVDLTPRTPTFAENRFQQLFVRPKRRAANAQGSPPRIVFQGITDRLSFLPIGYDVYAQAISPNGKMLLVSATSAGQQNLYLFPLDESGHAGVARQITASPGGKIYPQWSRDGRTVYYLSSDGSVHAVSLGGDGPADTKIALTASFYDDWNRDKVEAFTEAWSAIRDFYADPRTNGVDWNAVRAKYLPQFEGAQNPREMRRLLRLMIGELNSSHTGVFAPSIGSTRVTGHLGLDFDRVTYERDGVLRIVRVIAQSPAAVSGKIFPGDELLAVNGAPIDAHANLDQLLDNTIGKKVVLTVRHDGVTREVAVKPDDYATASYLRYLQWVADNASYVNRVSGGRLGYVHMIDMEMGSLQKLYRDINTQMFGKEGVVIDVRSNYGGFVNAYALDVFSREHYLNMTPRNSPTFQAREMLGQRALEKPTVLVVNASTLSDGEDFTQGYEAMHLGKVIGEPTAGWIIYTSAIALVDGTIFRLPSTRITTNLGKPMELHPRPVDVEVQRPIGSGARPQLDAAVKVLLEQLRRGH